MAVLAWSVGSDGLAGTGGFFQRLSGIGGPAGSLALPEILLIAVIMVGVAGIAVIVSALRLRQNRLEMMLRGRSCDMAGSDDPGPSGWMAAEAGPYPHVFGHRVVAAPSAAVAQARRSLAGALSDADVALIVDPLPEVFAEPDALVDIFTRLIDNAVRFRSPHRRPVVHISAARDGAMIEFRIRDNGLGIDPARAARLFEILRQTGAGDDSIGAGLSLVRRRVEWMGGTIWVDLSPGQVGTTFGFSMPALPITAASRPLSRRCQFGQTAI